MPGIQTSQCEVWWMDEWSLQVMEVSLPLSCLLDDTAEPDLSVSFSSTHPSLQKAFIEHLQYVRQPVRTSWSRMNQTVPEATVTISSSPFRSWIPMILSNFVHFFLVLDYFWPLFPPFILVTFWKSLLVSLPSPSVSVCFLFALNDTQSHILRWKSQGDLLDFRQSCNGQFFWHANWFGAGTWFCVSGWAPVTRKCLTDVLLYSSFSATSPSPFHLDSGLLRTLVHAYRHTHTRKHSHSLMHPLLKIKLSTLRVISMGAHGTGCGWGDCLSCGLYVPCMAECSPSVSGLVQLFLPPPFLRVPGWGG